MESTLNVGVIGAGRMPQRAHIPNLLAEKCRIVAIADPRFETAKLVAAHFGIDTAFGYYEDLLADDDIEAVVVAVPDPFHATVAIAALEAGKHVFIEKPLATNRDDGRAMVAAAHKAGRKLSVAYQRRHDPAAEVTRRLMGEFAQSGEMGAIRSMEWKNFGGEWDWNADPLISAGDARPDEAADPHFPSWLPRELWGEFSIFNNGLSHGVDLIMSLVGRPTSVIAAYPRWSATTMALFDWSGVRTLFAAASTEGSTWQEWLEIRYQHGWLRFSTPPALHANHPGVVEVYRGRQGRREVYEAPHEWAFRREIQHFLRCVREDIPESPTPEEALLNLCLMEDIFRQAARMPEPLPITSS